MEKWIQKAKTGKRKGALHRQLGIPEGKKIPTMKLRKIEKAKLGTKVGKVKVTKLLKRRAVFALNVRK